jgi:hypothetical protein
METACYPEALASTYKTTQRQNPRQQQNVFNDMVSIIISVTESSLSV